MDYTCFMDIETIPAQRDDVRARIAATVTPPGSIKKAETLAAWEAETRPAAEAEAIAKTSFDPAHGHICTIAWAMDGDDPDVAHAETVDQEADVLRAFFNALRPNHRYSFVGHYIGGFDLRFILCRAVVLGVPIPRCIPRDPKPWDTMVFDTMTAWAGQRGTIGMDKLCEALGIEGKGDFSGADVAEAWATGEHGKIAQYCADDVIRVRQIWQRFQDANW